MSLHNHRLCARNPEAPAELMPEKYSRVTAILKSTQENEDCRFVFWNPLACVQVYCIVSRTIWTKCHRTRDAMIKWDAL